jgi:hypothetical protein
VNGRRARLQRAQAGKAASFEVPRAAALTASRDQLPRSVLIVGLLKFSAAARLFASVISSHSVLV